MTVEVAPFRESHAEEWDAFVREAGNATFQQTRRFLAYHGDRFADASCLLYLDGKLSGVFPAAVAKVEPDVVVSHPGAAFGGVVHTGRLGGNRMVEALNGLISRYRASGFSRLRYKVLPPTYAAIPAQDDLYALQRVGATRSRCELSSTIRLDTRREPSARRLRSLKKAQRAVRVAVGHEHLEALYSVIAANLAREHGAAPVHSMEELRMLTARFPQEIEVLVAIVDGAVEAGVVLFNNAQVWHAQYIAASERAYAVCALDGVFDVAIRSASAAGARYFDFGTSNEGGGTVLNDGLYRFKSEFGGGGVVHEQYEVPVGSGGAYAR